MTDYFRISSRSVCTRLFVAGAIAMSSLGCQLHRPAATIELNSTQESRKLNQRFANAYFSRDAGGDYDIVLSDDGSNDAAHLNNVLHVRVLWLSKRMMRGDVPTAANASIHWTVFTQDGTGAVSYDGVGFASIYGSDSQIRVRLDNVSLKPASQAGNLGDPIGQSTLAADFKAKLNPGAVRSTIEMARQAVASSPTKNDPPPRPPTP